jgi:hypothetical protein
MQEAMASLIRICLLLLAAFEDESNTIAAFD